MNLINMLKYNKGKHEAEKIFLDLEPTTENTTQRS